MPVAGKDGAPNLVHSAIFPLEVWQTFPNPRLFSLHSFRPCPDLIQKVLIWECVDGEFDQVGWGERFRGVIRDDENVEEMQTRSMMSRMSSPELPYLLVLHVSFSTPQVWFALFLWVHIPLRIYFLPLKID